MHKTGLKDSKTVEKQIFYIKSTSNKEKGEEILPEIWVTLETLRLSDFSDSSKQINKEKKGKRQKVITPYEGFKWPWYSNHASSNGTNHDIFQIPAKSNYFTTVQISKKKGATVVSSYPISVCHALKRSIFLGLDIFDWLVLVSAIFMWFVPADYQHASAFEWLSNTL